MIFVNITENSSVATNDTEISGISTPLEIGLGTHFHVQHGAKTILVVLPVDGEAPWLLLQSSDSLLSGGIVQPEKTYSCILKVTDQIWESQRRMSINTNHSYHHKNKKSTPEGNFIVIPSLEGWPTKAKEAPFPRR